MALLDRMRGSEDTPLVDHLEELRWRIIWSLVALVIGSVAGFYLVVRYDLLAVFVAPVEPYLEGGKLRYLSPADPFMVTLKMAVAIGVILCFPVILYQLWRFLSPMLEDDEKRVVLPALWMGVVLFLAGVSLAYFGVLPLSLRFFSGFAREALAQNLVVGKFLGFVLKLMLGFGLVFETPMVMLVLGAMGLVTSSMLRAGRRFAIALAFVIGAVLTPPDVFSQLLMALPLMLLFEISIWLVRWVERRRSRLEPSET